MSMGGNRKSEVARPGHFAKSLESIDTSITASQLASIQHLPVMQQLKAMQSLGNTELKALDTIEGICNKEIAYLLQRLKPNTVASVITQYKRTLDSKGYKNHPYQLYFKLPAQLMTERKETYRAAVMAENKALKPFYNESGYLEMTGKLLKSEKSYIRIMLGLCAATGRRPGEMLTTAKFTKSGKNSVIFSGQLKTKDSEQARDNYEIPTLLPADDVIGALERLRAKKDFSGLPVPAHKTLAQVVNARTAKQQSEYVKTYYSDFIPNPRAYNLRAVYALLCVRKHKPADMTDQAYMAQILGHSENDSTTAASYLDFYYAGEDAPA